MAGKPERSAPLDHVRLAPSAWRDKNKRTTKRTLSSIVLLAVLTERVRQVSRRLCFIRSTPTLGMKLFSFGAGVRFTVRRARDAMDAHGEGKRQQPPGRRGGKRPSGSAASEARQTPETRAQTEGRRASGSSAWQLVLRTARHNKPRGARFRAQPRRSPAPLTATERSAAAALAAIIITPPTSRLLARLPPSSSSSGVIIIIVGLRFPRRVGRLSPRSRLRCRRSDSQTARLSHSPSARART